MCVCYMFYSPRHAVFSDHSWTMMPYPIGSCMQLPCIILLLEEEIIEF